MPSFIELLQQAQRELSCPSCGRSFRLSEIRPRGRAGGTIMLQAVCANNHFPVVLVFIPSKPLEKKIQPIGPKDLNALAARLKAFDGNFAAIWSSRHR